MSTAGNEGQRLAKLYAETTDEELEELADSADSLTDTAKGALKDELSRRKLDIALREPMIPGEEVELPKVVVLRQFRDVPAALRAKSILGWRCDSCGAMWEDSPSDDASKPGIAGRQ